MCVWRQTLKIAFSQTQTSVASAWVLCDRIHTYMNIHSFIFFCNRFIQPIIIMLFILEEQKDNSACCVHHTAQWQRFRKKNELKCTIRIKSMFSNSKIDSTRRWRNAFIHTFCLSPHTYTSVSSRPIMEIATTLHDACKLQMPIQKFICCFELIQHFHVITISGQWTNTKPSFDSFGIMEHSKLESFHCNPFSLARNKLASYFYSSSLHTCRWREFKPNRVRTKSKQNVWKKKSIFRSSVFSLVLMTALLFECSKTINRTNKIVGNKCGERKKKFKNSINRRRHVQYGQFQELSHKPIDNKDNCKLPSNYIHMYG